MKNEWEKVDVHPAPYTIYETYLVDKYLLLTPTEVGLIEHKIMLV